MREYLSTSLQDTLGFLDLPCKLCLKLLLPFNHLSLQSAVYHANFIQILTKNLSGVPPCVDTI
jgi:hypothetical protein